MIQHAADCWDHKHFKELLQSANSEVTYRAIDFYLEQHPSNVNELLTDLSNKLEAGRVVTQFSSPEGIIIDMIPEQHRFRCINV